MAQQGTALGAAQPTIIDIDPEDDFDLEDEVEAIIRPYARNTLKPPFSPAELSVMAWVCFRNVRDVITEERIFKWILRHFKYYAELALHDAYSLSRHNTRKCPNSNLRGLYNGIANETAYQSVPMYLICVVMDGRQYPTTVKSYTSTLTSARTFLRRTLGNELKEFVRFLELPVEIRLMIYAEVLRFNGKLEFLNPLLTATAPRQVLLSSAYERQTILDRTAFGENQGAWDLPEVRDNVTALSGNILSLLLTNRQVFEEAMPVFYNINTFQASDMYGLVRMLRLCGERRSVHFSRIEFMHPYQASAATAKTAFNLLSQVKQLQYVAIHATDKAYETRLAWGWDQTAWLDPISRLRVRSIDCLGDCPILRALVQDKRSQTKSEDAQVPAKKEKRPKTPRKRSKKSAKAKA